MALTSHPVIIQGGMGVAVSAWQLARAVSETGQLGVVSGTALDVTLVRRLQLGDPGGHIRRALAEFPFVEMADRILQRYFIPGGKATDERFRPSYVIPVEPTQKQLELVVVGNFVEVYLAKEGHTGLVGINFLEKIQVPTLPSLFGAMLAGVDYVLMGAGIPRAIPGAMDLLSNGEAAELALYIEGADRSDRFVTRFDPAEFTDGELPWLDRPKFLAIVASNTLASMLKRKATGRVDGFVVEGPTAGGHNAPPRGGTQLNDRGEPIYGERDIVDLDAIGALGLPFWVAGSYGTPEKLVEALDAGATGIQVGTAFAFCDESGLPSDLKERVLQMSRNGTVDVVTDASASPTGFPFKVLSLEETISNTSVYEKRPRNCDLGFLRQGYKKSNGTIGWRCPAEPVDAYVRKGGEASETEGSKCVCNGLMANVGFGQVRRDGTPEPSIFTCGDDAKNVARYLKTADATSYSAKDVIEHLLSGVQTDKLATCSLEVQ